MEPCRVTRGAGLAPPRNPGRAEPGLPNAGRVSLGGRRRGPEAGPRGAEWVRTQPKATGGRPLPSSPMAQYDVREPAWKGSIKSVADLQARAWCRPGLAWSRLRSARRPSRCVVENGGPAKGGRVGRGSVECWPGERRSRSVSVQSLGQCVGAGRVRAGAGLFGRCVVRSCEHGPGTALADSASARPRLPARVLPLLLAARAAPCVAWQETRGAAGAGAGTGPAATF